MNARWLSQRSNKLLAKFVGAVHFWACYVNFVLLLHQAPSNKYTYIPGVNFRLHCKLEVIRMRISWKILLRVHQLILNLY